MGPLTTLLALPIGGPIGAVGWIARQVAEAALSEMLDPARIESALLALERRLEAGAITETAYDAEEARLLEELAEIRALRDGASDGAASETPDHGSSDAAAPPTDGGGEPAAAAEDEPWTPA